MKYYIPKNKIENLKKIIKRYSKKSDVFSMTLGETVVKEGVLTLIDWEQGENRKTQRNVPINVECVEVDVSGFYKNGDWSFVGVVEFTENGNIIRLADNSFEGKVPERYNHTPKICEHCGTIRNRKDTFLIFNNATGEFKQVGSSCLLEYTRGLDANVCASIMSCLDKIVDLTAKVYEEDDFFSFGSCLYLSNFGPYLKLHAVEIVRREGYKKSEFGEEGTAKRLARTMEGAYVGRSSSLSDKEFDFLTKEVEKIDEFAKSITDTCGYMYNAKLAWLKECNVEYRDLALICSFVSVYYKEQQKKAQKAISQYVGNVGDRINVVINSVKVLYTKYPFTYNGDYTYVYKIIDEQGRVYVWSTTTYGLDSEDYIGKTIKATVKSHSEFNGEKQTVITRGVLC